MTLSTWESRPEELPVPPQIPNPNIIIMFFAVLYFSNFCGKSPLREANIVNHNRFIQNIWISMQERLSVLRCMPDP